MQERKVWTWVVGAALLAISIAQGSRDADDGPDQATASDLLRDPGKKGATIARRRTDSPWAVFRADWTAVLWRIYRKMNDNRLLAVAAGVVFYGLLALFPAVTAFVSLYGLVADPSTIHEHLSLVAGVLPQGALDIVNEQLLRLTAHRTSALSLGFIGGLLFALWSANAGSKAMMDGLNVAYGETEKRGFVLLNLVALAFTARRDHRAHAGSERSGDRSDRALAFWVGQPHRCADWNCALASSAGARASRLDDALPIRPQPRQSAVDLAFPRKRPGCHCLASGLGALLLVHCQFRQLRRDLWLVGRGDRHDDVDVDFYDRCASRSRAERRARSSRFSSLTHYPNAFSSLSSRDAVSYDQPEPALIEPI